MFTYLHWPNHLHSIILISHNVSDYNIYYLLSILYYTMCYSLHQGYIKDALRASRKENDASWELMLLKDCTIVVLKAQGRVYENTALRLFHFFS